MFSRFYQFSLAVHVRESLCQFPVDLCITYFNFEFAKRIFNYDTRKPTSAIAMLVIPSDCYLFVFKHRQKGYVMKKTFEKVLKVALKIKKTTKLC